MTDEQIDFIATCYFNNSTKVWEVPYDSWDENIKVMKELRKLKYTFGESDSLGDCHLFI